MPAASFGCLWAKRPSDFKPDLAFKVWVWKQRCFANASSSSHLYHKISFLETRYITYLYIFTVNVNAYIRHTYSMCLHVFWGGDVARRTRLQTPAELNNKIPLEDSVCLFLTLFWQVFLPKQLKTRMLHTTKKQEPNFTSLFGSCARRCATAMATSHQRPGSAKRFWLLSLATECPTKEKIEPVWTSWPIKQNMCFLTWRISLSYFLIRVLRSLRPMVLLFPELFQADGYRQQISHKKTVGTSCTVATHQNGFDFSKERFLPKAVHHSRVYSIPLDVISHVKKVMRFASQFKQKFPFVREVKRQPPKGFQVCADTWTGFICILFGKKNRWPLINKFTCSLEIVGTRCQHVQHTVLGNTLIRR